MSAESGTEGRGRPHVTRSVRSRFLRVSLIIFVSLLAVWIFRIPILRSAGTFLIRTDAACQADAIYVLGGAPFDRGSQVTHLLRDGCARVAYCTGSNISQAYRSEGRMLTEADLTRSAAIQSGADPGRVLPYPFGTSTWEEAIGVLRHARMNHMDTILVLTTEFHTRRVRNVFHERFQGSGITVLVHAAPSTEYDAGSWWNSEQGLLMVNNEYVKTVYYVLKH